MATELCSVQGCHRKLLARGWCSTHYKRWFTRGDPREGEPVQRRVSLAERFWDRVRWVGYCWEWQGHKTRDGYGQVGVDGKLEYAHRVAWRLVFGLPGQRYVLHRCDNPPCVRPDHLFLGDHATNMRDMRVKGRHSNQWGV